MNNTEKNRQMNYVGMFDLTKGLFMIMIILLHAVTDYFKYWEYDFSVNPIIAAFLFPAQLLLYGMGPMFFMICGYNIKKRKRKACLAAQKRIFLKPYILVTVAVFFFVIIKKCVLHSEIQEYLEGIKYQVVPYFLGFCPGERSFMGLYMDSIGPIWFFLVFVSASVVLNEVLQLEHVFEQITILCILSIIGVELRFVTLPFCLQQTLICTGYMYFGMLCKKADVFNRKISCKMIALIVAFCYGISLFGYVEISQNVWKLGLSDLLVSYMAGGVLLLAFQKINAFQGKIAERIRWIGRHAMWICCIHTVLYTAIPWDRMAGKFENQYLIGFVFELAIQLLLSVGLCKVIERGNRRPGRRSASC